MVKGDKREAYFINCMSTQETKELAWKYVKDAINVYTKNAYPKVEIYRDGSGFISLFEDEFDEDFYYISHTMAIYKYPKPYDKAKVILEHDSEIHFGRDKSLIPIEDLELVCMGEGNATWNIDMSSKFKDNSVSTQEAEPEPDSFDTGDVYEDDVSFSKMTLREYACMHLGVPETKYPWLNAIIRKSKEE